MTFDSIASLPEDEIRHDFYAQGDIIPELIACGECGFVAKVPVNDDGTTLIHLDVGDAEALLRMFRTAKNIAISTGECGPWFDTMIARIETAFPEGDR